MLNKWSRLVYFSPDEPPAGSGSQITPPPPAGGEPQNKGGEPQAVSITQADLDKQFGARAKQAATAKEKALLEALGVENLDDAKAMVKAAKDAEAANATEVETATKRADDAEGKLETLRADNASLKLRQKFDVKVRALELKFANEAAEEDAFKALDTEAVGEDFKGMEDAIKQLEEDRPYLFSEEEGKPRVPKTDGKEKGAGNTSAASQTAVAAKRKQISGL